MTTETITELVVQEKRESTGSWVDFTGPWGNRRDAVDYARQYDKPMRVVRRHTTTVQHDETIYSQKESPNK
jgi:hypothetical protein